MSAKSRDGQWRWRSKTIGVRISPEENAELDALVALSGMKKQDYCINRMLQDSANDDADNHCRAADVSGNF